jgi:hypothetical protein
MSLGVDAILVVAGALVVLAAVWDIAVTVLDPAAPGPVSFRIGRLVWAALHRAARASGRRRLLRASGPTTIATSVIVWLGALWLGFALIYTAYAEQLFYAGVPPSSAAFVDGLYVSGTALTTIGFGDVVPRGDALRILTVLEGAAGLGTITAAITYLLSVYLVLGRIRHSSLRLSDLGLADPAVAAKWVESAGVGQVARVHEDVSETHEDLRRFPNLYYFHSPAPAESVAALLRTATVLSLVLRFGIDSRRIPFADSYGRALEATLARVIEEYEKRFLRGRERPSPLDDEAAREALHILRQAVPQHLRRDDGLPDDFLVFLPHAESFVNDLARIELFDERPLLERAGEADTAPEASPVAAGGATSPPRVPRA